VVVVGDRVIVVGVAVEAACVGAVVVGDLRRIIPKRITLKDLPIVSARYPSLGGGRDMVARILRWCVTGAAMGVRKRDDRS
jgi:hypothetical protein